MKSDAFSVAPMIDCTDRHFRYFVRLMTRHATLYTEMIHCQAIIKGDRCQLLDFSSAEHPLVIQLGGSDPEQLAEAAAIAEQWGYDEVNLNVGCPSPRVQAGRFGACLMAEPALVAACVDRMQSRVSLPVTIKTRLGIDHQDDDEFLENFISAVAQAGCQKVILHARKAWLHGLSPKQNRCIPPLRYEAVSQVKRKFPGLTVILNGGLKDLLAAKKNHEDLDGIMVGREAYTNPYSLSWVDSLFYDDTRPLLSREQVVQALRPYIEEQLAKKVPLHSMTRHLHGLYYGQPHARQWRRQLSAKLDGFPSE